jgi:hypothetical protein
MRSASILTILVLTVGASFASPMQMRFTVDFNPLELQIDRVREFDGIRLEGCSSLEDPGCPALPVQVIHLAVPEGMRVTDVSIAEMRSERIPGTYRIFPAQYPVPLTDEIERPEFVEPDPSIYGSFEPFPGEWAEFLGQTDLAGQAMAAVRVHPVRYVPGTGELTLATYLELVLEGVSGYEMGDYLPVSISRSGHESYERAIRSRVVNPGDVVLRRSPKAPLSRGVEAGEYDYVIVTRTDWVDDFQPLSEWRTKHGMRATIVTTDWIFDQGGYSGTDLEKMRSFVQDAHDTWGAMYFLLGGDSDLFPYDTDTIMVPGYGESAIVNYTYYADYDDDWSLEVNLGNASVQSPGDIGTFLSKVFTYEKTPPADYATWATFFGLDISYCGDGDGELFKENYIRPYFPVDWTINTEYDSEPGTHKTDIMAYLNQGHHLVNHHDHDNQNCMGTGYICHGELMYTNEVQNLTNGDRQSIVIAVGCYPADFSYYTSIGEGFVRNPNGGAIVFMGNTSIGWGGSGSEPDKYSLGQDKLFYRNLFDLGVERMGDNFTLAKNDEYDPYDPLNLHEFSFLQFHLLGDPGLLLWSGEPEEMEVTAEGTLIAGVTSPYEVQVTSGGSPVDGATVCLWKGDEVYEVGVTSGGTVTLDVTPSTPGTMFVTVICQNHLPFEGEVDVTEGLCGDANGDGMLTTGDGFFVLNYFGAGPEPVSCWASNVNGDDGLTTGDGFHMLNYFGGGPTLDCAPCEF